MEFSNRSKYDLNNFARSVSRIEFSNRSKYNLNNFDQSVSRVVLYSESDLKERYLRYIASESNYIYSSSSSSESESERSSIYLDSKERLIGEEETEDEDEEEEEQSDVEEVEESSAVDWPSIPSSPTSGPSGSSGWECIGKEADDVRPGNDILRYSALDLDEDERNGVLTDRIVATGQSCLGVCPGTKGYVYTKLVLVQKNIVDISVLQYHRYLQCIDISWNKLEDVSALGYVRHLMHLDVSHNRLCDALKFRAPWFLTDVNYSYNDVKSLDDLSDFWSVKNLNLSHNSITTITGLEKLRYLQNLDLSYNNITCLQNLNHLNIFELNLENNNLSEYDDSMRLSTLPNLKYLNLNNNKFTTLQFLRGVYSVRCMEMKNNAVAELLEVDNMKTMTLLEELDFSCNPITTWPGYRDAVIHSLPALAYLDGEPVTVGEKLSSMLTFEADVRLLAAQNHASLLLASPEIDCDIPPFDEPAHPLFVLVGPTASGKARLLQNIRKTFGNKIVVGVRHTTRNRMEGGCEEDGVDYHFISQQKFNDLLRGGAFLSTVTARGNSCGLSRMELAKAVQMRRMCITEMELEEALTLFLSGVRPCLILAIPESESLHHARLKSKYEGSKLGGAVHIRRRLCDAATPESAETSSKTLATQLMEDVLSGTERMITESERSQRVTKQAADVLASRPELFSESSVSSARSFPNSESFRDVEYNAMEQSWSAGNTNDSASNSLPLRVTQDEKQSMSSGSTTNDPDYYSTSTTECSSENTRSFQMPTEEELGVSEDTWMDSVLRSRRIYFKLHNQKPGFFEETVYTDDLRKACFKLKRFLKAYPSGMKNRPLYSVTSDPLYEKMVLSRVDKFTEELNRRTAASQHS